MALIPFPEDAEIIDIPRLKSGGRYEVQIASIFDGHDGVWDSDAQRMTPNEDLPTITITQVKVLSDFDAGPGDRNLTGALVDVRVKFRQYAHQQFYKYIQLLEGIGFQFRSSDPVRIIRGSKDKGHPLKGMKFTGVFTSRTFDGAEGNSITIEDFNIEINPELQAWREQQAASADATAQLSAVQAAANAEAEALQASASLLGAEVAEAEIVEAEIVEEAPESKPAPKPKTTRATKPKAEPATVEEAITESVENPGPATPKADESASGDDGEEVDDLLKGLDSLLA